MIQIFLAKYLYREPLGEWGWIVQYRGNSILSAQLIWNSLEKGSRWWDGEPDVPDVVPIDDYDHHDDDDDDDRTDEYDATAAIADGVAA